MREASLEKLKNLDRPVMITGHTGFKGTWLTLLLESQGIEVSGLSLHPEENSLYSRLGRSSKIHENFIDICDFDSVNSVINSVKPSIIFHMAAQPLVLQSYIDPRGTFETNVMGTANILESVSGLKDRCYVVAVTTDKVYENLETGRKFKEEDKLKGKDPYSASKVGTESVITAWKNIWKANNSHKICSVRAGNVIGGGDWSEDRLIPDAFRAVKYAKPLMIRAPKSTRPWQHVLESLSGYLLLGQRLFEEGKAYADAWNFGPSSEGNQNVEKVISLMKENWPAIEWQSENGIQPHEANLLQLDSTKAMQILKWQPVWSFNEGVIETAKWYKSYLETGKSDSLTQIKEFVKKATEAGITWTTNGNK